MRLDGKVAVVTGAGRGIGRVIASRFVEDGASVVAVDIKRRLVMETVRKLNHRCDRLRGLCADVSSVEGANSIVQFALEAFGRLDILVNNAGICLSRSVLEMSLQEWESMIQVNLSGTFLCSQAAGRIMAASRTGAIVNIASIWGLLGVQNRSAYGASKAGVIVFTSAMALELAPFGVRVNAIAPGPVISPMTRLLHSAETRDQYRRAIPLGRYANACEIAAAAAFLASDDAGYITGHTLVVDGGFVAARTGAG